MRDRPPVGKVAPQLVAGDVNEPAARDAFAARGCGHEEGSHGAYGGIHRIDGVRGAHTYLVPAADGLYVVDTGMPGNAARILAYRESLGRKPKDVGIILLTRSKAFSPRWS